MAADPVGRGAEWNAFFRSDISSLLDDAAIDAAVDVDRPLELSPRDGVSYTAFVDASSGVSGGDHYTLAIGHKDGERYVADVVTGFAPPFDPSVVTAKLAEVVKAYRISKISGDYYSAGWVESAWNGLDGLKYIRSEKPKSTLFLEALPLFARQLVNLPDHPKLVRELRLLERSTTRAGRTRSTTAVAVTATTPTCWRACWRNWRASRNIIHFSRACPMPLCPSSRSSPAAPISGRTS